MKTDTAKPAENCTVKQENPETKGCPDYDRCHWITAAGIEMCTVCGAIE